MNSEIINLIIPPRHLVSVYCSPRGKVTGSSRLDPSSLKNLPDEPLEEIIKQVKVSASKRILFLSHAVRQMSRPDRMITTSEVRSIIATGVVVEDYSDDPRGHSCLLLGRGTGDRPVHVVCSPKPDFLAIITAYLPRPNEWSDDFTERLNQ